MCEPMTPPVVRFYFDYISTNAYLAWTQLPSLGARYGYEVEPVPVLFAGLLEAHGQVGPAEVPAKALWMAKNCLRKAVRLGVPLNRPAYHPFNPLLALRVSSLPMDDGARAALVDALFQAVWVRGLHVAEPEPVIAVANEIGLDGAALVAQASEAPAKVRLRQQTDDAIAQGVFGVPTMMVGDEPFFGYDDFPQLQACLAGEDPLAASSWESWLGGPQPSAMRRQFRDRLAAD